MTRVAVGLGSNLGDRVAHLDYAVLRLQSFIRELKMSRYYETAPMGADGPQPLFLNAAAVGVTALPPKALLDAMLGVEQERGRTRPRPLAPRTLDLDLVLFGNLIVEEAGLVIPHPRFRERRFVLEPLAEIAPDLVDPVTSKSVEELLAALNP